MIDRKTNTCHIIQKRKTILVYLHIGVFYAKVNQRALTICFCIGLSNWGARYGNTIPIPAPIPGKNFRGIPSPSGGYLPNPPRRGATCQKGALAMYGISLDRMERNNRIVKDAVKEVLFLFFIRRIRFLADCNRINHNQSHGNTSHTYLIFQCIKTLANKFEQSF